MAIEHPKNTSSVDAALRWVGDLDHPFYGDERQRSVWYEAPAIGFQMLLMLQFVTCGLILLIAGRPALTYVSIALLPAIFTSVVVVGYSHKRGAQYFAQGSDLRRGRGLVAVGISLVLAAGLLRAAMQDASASAGVTFDVSTIAGLVTGGGAVLLVGWLLQRKLTRAGATEADDEF